VILRHSVAFNLNRAPERPALAGPDRLLRLDALCETLQTPRTLRGIGLPEEIFEMIATDILAGPAATGNPCAVTRDDVLSILVSCR
jgi:alcohol dehydrogenase class IV